MSKSNIIPLFRWPKWVQRFREEYIHVAAYDIVSVYQGQRVAPDLGWYTELLVHICYATFSCLHWNCGTSIKSLGNEIDYLLQRISEEKEGYLKALTEAAAKDEKTC